MNRELHETRVPINLGKATTKTQGGPGPMTDFVRGLEHWGISRD